MLYPNRTATFNQRDISMPKTVDKSIILERIGEYTSVRLSSGKSLNMVVIFTKSLIFLKVLE